MLLPWRGIQQEDYCILAIGWLECATKGGKMVL